MDVHEGAPAKLKMLPGASLRLWLFKDCVSGAAQHERRLIVQQTDHGEVSLASRSCVEKVSSGKRPTKHPRSFFPPAVRSFLKYLPRAASTQAATISRDCSQGEHVTLVEIYVAEPKEISCFLEQWVWIGVWRWPERMDLHKLSDLVSIQQFIAFLDIECAL